MLNFLSDHRTTWIFDLLLLFICIGVFFALWLGAHPLMVPDEARYSEVAREMMALHDYLTPHLNGTVLMDKPVLFYWLQVSAFKLFGLNEWSARVWPALLGTIGCLFTYSAGRILYDRRTGILSAIVLATSPLYFSLAHYANLDIEVGVFITGALFSFIVAMKYPTKTIFLYIAYLFVGLALLTKGLIGILLPMIIIGLWILILQRWHTLKNMRLVTGLMLTCVIAAPWYVAMQIAHHNFFQYFFVNQQFTRYLSQDFNNAQPSWFYIPILVIGLFPWLYFLPKAFMQKLNAVWLNKQYYQTEVFLLLWPCAIFVFFTLPNSKTIGYMAPIVAPIALIIGHYLSSKNITKLFTIFTIVSSILLLTLSAIMSHLNTQTIKPLAMQLTHILEPVDQVVVYEHYYYDLPVYLQRQVRVVSNWQDPSIANNDNWEHELWQGSKAKTATIQLLDDDTFMRLWQSPQRVFVFTDDRHYDQLKHLVHDKFILVEQYKDIFLISNKE